MPRVPVRSLLAVAGLCSFAFVCEDQLTTPAPAVAIKPARLEKLDELACSACHADVVREWADTAHALAWVDEAYVEELADKRKPESCYGCHIPKPILTGDLAQRPKARDDERRFGVTCASCHLAADGAMLGPRDEQTSAHASKRSEIFVEAGSDALCASCHRTNIGPVVGIAKDFEKSGQAARGKSCVGCHLAPVEMRFANATALGAPAARASDIPLRKGRSHALQTPRDPAFLRRAFDVSLRVEGDKSFVVIKNVAGHRVPGLIGRSIEFRGEVLDAQRAVLGTGRLVFDANSPLSVDDNVEIAIGAVGASVHLAGMHTDPRAEQPMVFLDRELAPQPR